MTYFGGVLWTFSGVHVCDIFVNYCYDFSMFKLWSKQIFIDNIPSHKSIFKSMVNGSSFVPNHLNINIQIIWCSHNESNTYLQSCLWNVNHSDKDQHDENRTVPANSPWTFTSQLWLSTVPHHYIAGSFCSNFFIFMGSCWVITPCHGIA